jgi:hypothetical protein
MLIVPPRICVEDMILWQLEGDKVVVRYLGPNLL